MNDVADPILKQAREEIEAVIRKYDIGAHVVLHRPGKCEHFANYVPSYSILRMEGPHMRVRSKLEEYGGDKAAQQRDIEATVNMVEFFADILGGNGAAFQGMRKMLGEKFDIENTPMRHRPDPPKGAH